jgi:hypothetical protein
MIPTDYRQLLACSDAESHRVDPLVSNLLVARSIPALAHLDIPRYQRWADERAAEIKAWLPQTERQFRNDPGYFRNDINFFRLGGLHHFLEKRVGIAYREDQRNVTSILYTDPSDLFLNGVMDTGRGTCGNMAALYVAIGWRLGWPVSLACVRSHYVCRYDDGKVQHNIEATQSGYGGFKSDPDEHLMAEHRLPSIAVACGSDLRAVTPREMLGIFVGFRGRHMRDTGQYDQAHQDYLLARWLFPTSRRLYVDSMALSVPYGEKLFQPDEVGSPCELTAALTDQYGHRGSGYPPPGGMLPITTFTSR